MKIICFILLFLSLNGHSAEKKELESFESQYYRTYLSASGGPSVFSLNSGSYSNFAFALNVGYHFLPELALEGHYFLAPNISGASNLNGLGIKAKYYFWNTETTFKTTTSSIKIESHSEYFAYGGLSFLDREIRTSVVAVNYSGLGLSVGLGKKLSQKNALSAEMMYSKLQKPSGSTEQGTANLMFLSLTYSFYF